MCMEKMREILRSGKDLGAIYDAPGCLSGEMITSTDKNCDKESCCHCTGCSGGIQYWKNGRQGGGDQHVWGFLLLCKSCSRQVMSGILAVADVGEDQRERDILSIGTDPAGQGQKNMNGPRRVGMQHDI